MKKWILMTLTIFSVLLWASLGISQEVELLNQAIGAKGASWIAGDTTMTRLSPRERQKRLGLLEHGLTGEEPMLFAAAPLVGLPSYYDWRSSGFVTPIRNQGSCGSCWAFATTAAFESYLIIRNNTPGSTLNLSEQVLVSCGKSGGCGGGYVSGASDYFVTDGLPLESCYPYTATNGACTSACADRIDTAYKLNKWAYVANPYMPSSVDSIKSALVTYGPLVTTMAVYQDFFSYQSGIYSYVSGSYAGGHAITIVGYDDATQSFTVKNSWGSGWGEGGYFRIAYSQLRSVVKFGEWTIAYGDPVTPPQPPPPNPETVSAPTSLSGTTSGSTNTLYSYQTGGSAMSNPSGPGHTIEYQFDWGDGTSSDWVSTGAANKSWPNAGTYSIRSRAQCSIDKIPTSWSPVLSVTIAGGSTTLSVVSPNGGEIIPYGSYYTVKWNAGNQATRFRLYYSDNDGKTWRSVASVTGTGGSYAWRAPRYTYTQTKCRFRVIGYDSNGIRVGDDQSDSAFTLVGYYGRVRRVNR